MTSLHSTLKPEPSEDPSAKGSIWDDPNDRPCIKVFKRDAGSCSYFVTPETTLALKPGKGKPMLPNHYGVFYVHPDLPSHPNPERVSQDPLSHGTVALQSNSIVTWHPNGQDGPSEQISKLPFFVHTNPFGESESYYGEQTVPLPPTQGHSNAARIALGYLPVYPDPDEGDTLRNA